jgi:hypothetical protein
MKVVIEMRLIELQSTAVYWYAGTTADGSAVGLDRHLWVINRRRAVTLTCKSADALIERLHALVRARGHNDISFHRQAVG